MAGKSGFWNDERLAESKRLFKEGASYSVIADALGNGITRSAVAGKLIRMGVKRDSVPDRPRPPRRVARKEPVVANAKPPETPAPMAPPPAATPPQPSALPDLYSAEAVFDIVPASPALPEPQGASKPPVLGAAMAVVALTGDECKWPIGDPRLKDFRFCCAPRAGHAPYCSAHLDEATDFDRMRPRPGRPERALQDDRRAMLQ